MNPPVLLDIDHWAVRQHLTQHEIRDLNCGWTVRTQRFGLAQAISNQAPNKESNKQ